MRKQLAIQEYDITVRQSNVANVEPEQKFKEMLAKQRDAAAEASIKKQEAKRAEYDKQKIIAETAKKEAQIALEEAKLLKLKEIELAEKIKIAADAQSYQKRKVLEADGALEMKLATIEKIAEKISQGWANRQVPQTVIITGEQENTSQYTGSPQEIQIMLGMMLAEMAKNQLSTDLSIPKGRTAQ